MEFRIIEKSISYVQDEEYCIVMGRSHKCIRRTTGDTLTPGRQIGTEGSGIAVGELVVATLLICVVNSQDYSLDKRRLQEHLWPWRDWMTIGIGVLASASDEVRPDHLLLLSDTKGSFGDEFSMNHLHKMFIDPKMGLYAIAAGKMDKAAELYKTVALFYNDDRSPLQGYGKLFTAVHFAADCFKRVRFKYDVLPLFAHSPGRLRDDFDDSDLSPQLLEAWREFDFGCQMLVGGFDAIGTALLFAIEGNGQVFNCMFPGFAAIGTGMSNAMFWLSYRQHNLGFSVKRAAYHAFEAKLMAESSPFVNDQIDLIVANKNEHFLVTRAKPNPKGTPITIAELREMLERYGVRETDGLK